MAISLLTTEKKRIVTTLAKAKALRKFVEPLITKAKTNSTHSRRVVFSNLQNKYAVTELFGEIASRVGDRPGGYTRILKLGPRKGDNAEMALIELVDYNEWIDEAPKKKSSRRRRRASGKKKAEKPAAKVAETVEEKVEEAVETTTAETDSEDAPVAEADNSGEEE